LLLKRRAEKWAIARGDKHHDLSVKVGQIYAVNMKGGHTGKSLFFTLSVLS
jgi:hypothetical protein